ncbi:MAG: hypothetical protein ACQEXJ_21625 [Myxococcota bacterium]
MMERSSWWVTGLFAAVLFLGACEGKVTEADLQKWTHNDLGLERIGEVVANPEQPMDTRVRALEVVVEKGFATRIRTMLDEVPAEADRNELVSRLRERLMKHLADRTEAQFDAKDALMIMQRYLTPEEFAAVQEQVAGWAFRDITWDSSEADVKKKVESRIASGQIADLGPYGWEGAAILLSHGFAVDKMLNYLSEAQASEATEGLLKGLRRLHESIGIRLHHLEALARTERLSAAAYLLEIYGDEEYDADIRTSAFNSAVGMLDKSGIKEGDTKPVVQRLLKLMERKSPEDRWLGAVHIVRLTGAKHLDEVLGKFEDDGIYPRAEEPTSKTLLDFCLDIHDLEHSEEAVPVFMKHATGDDPVPAAISVVCLKANRAQQATKVLRELAEPADEPITLERFLGADYTLSALARNALEGLEMMREAAAAEEAGDLDEVEARNKRLIITFELKATGDAYEKVVADRFEKFRKQYEANPEAFE